MGVVNYLTLESEIVSETRGGVESDYIPDTLGSTSKLVTAGGTASNTFLWWPYGEQHSHAGHNPTPFGFGGTLGYCFESWGALYVRKRVYEPNVASWQSVDWLWPQEKAYVYATSNPSTVVDPSGLAPCQIDPSGGLSPFPPLGGLPQPQPDCNSCAGSIAQTWGPHTNPHDQGCNAYIHCSSCCELAKNFSPGCAVFYQKVENKLRPRGHIINNERMYWCELGLQAAKMPGSCLANCNHLTGSISPKNCRKFIPLTQPPGCPQIN